MDHPHNPFKHVRRLLWDVVTSGASTLYIGSHPEKSPTGQWLLPVHHTLSWPWCSSLLQWHRAANPGPLPSFLPLSPLPKLLQSLYSAYLRK